MSESTSTVKKTYPAPKDGKKFIEMWGLYHDAVVGHPKFKEHHLSLLETLCSLHQEKVHLEAILEVDGRTYQTSDKGIYRINTKPEVRQLAKIVDQIKGYSIVLGLTLTKHRDRKDNDLAASARDEKDEDWS